MAKLLTQTPATKVYVLLVEETPHGRRRIRFRCSGCGWELMETRLHGAYPTREKAQEARKALAAKRAFSGRLPSEWKASIRAVPLCA